MPPKLNLLTFLLSRTTVETHICQHESNSAWPEILGCHSKAFVRCSGSGETWQSFWPNTHVQEFLCMWTTHKKQLPSLHGCRERYSLVRSVVTGDAWSRNQLCEGWHIDWCWTFVVLLLHSPGLLRHLTSRMEMLVVSTDVVAARTTNGTVGLQNGLSCWPM